MKIKLVHCSYHKCLTVYFSRVLATICNRVIRFNGGYRHFNSLIDKFYHESDAFRVSSINNHVLDLERLGDEFRVTRFIRDPRDLVVSGYLYHKRGAEPWCNIIDPIDKDWEVVNGAIPKNLGGGHSFSAYLNSVSKDEGLKAEIEFRKRHFDSMMKWPMSDPRIKLFRYEDILGNEPDIFSKILEHYEFSWPERKLGKFLADRYSAKKQTEEMTHIRNPKIGQWKEHFSPEVIDYFNQQYGELLKRYGY